MDQSQIRNFAIIAHIDHGKSTLADRLMEVTGTVSHRDMQEQLLDSNPIERERGITIKLAPVRMEYQTSVRLADSKRATSRQTADISFQKATESEDSTLKADSYILNLIDTPGHVDFNYEVSRSLAACEGALLVVDASQGVQAQTLANLRLARANNLMIIPIVNKIDLPNARIEETLQELADLGFDPKDALCISAKTGLGIDEVIRAIIDRIPSPQGDPDKPTRALVFSSQYDTHKGVVVFVRVVDGSIDPMDQFQKKNETLRFLLSGSEVLPIGMGYFLPKMVGSEGLKTGEVGYIATGLKDVRMAKVGDTISVCFADRNVKLQNTNDKSISNEKIFNKTNESISDLKPLPGYHEPKPMVFVGLFPIEQEEFTKSREAMEKLRLSDSAFTFRPISSLALGNGFHCGFLGLLHAEVVQERLSREFDLSLLATAPSVEYQVMLNPGVNPSKAGIIHSATIGESDQSLYSIQSPTEFPDPTYIQEVREPIMQVTIFSPKKYVGKIMQLAQEKRGEYIDLVYHLDQAEFTYLIPLSDMIVDFFDTLKSVTEGYASLDYEFYDYQQADTIKVDILVNHEKVDALSFLIVKEQAHRRGKEIVEKLAEVLPRQQFSIPVQAAIGGEIVARADIKPFRKDVIAKLYGGDRTRKDKLLKKQKKGKEKMKRIGSVEIPQDAFFTVLKR
jgi:GTP-binding protein LepA